MPVFPSSSKHYIFCDGTSNLTVNRPRRSGLVRPFFNPPVPELFRARLPPQQQSNVASAETGTSRICLGYVGEAAPQENDDFSLHLSSSKPKNVITFDWSGPGTVATPVVIDLDDISDSQLPQQQLQQQEHEVIDLDKVIEVIDLGICTPPPVPAQQTTTTTAAVTATTTTQPGRKDVTGRPLNSHMVDISTLDRPVYRFISPNALRTARDHVFDHAHSGLLTTIDRHGFAFSANLRGTDSTTTMDLLSSSLSTSMGVFDKIEHVFKVIDGKYFALCNVFNSATDARNWKIKFEAELPSALPQWQPEMKSSLDFVQEALDLQRIQYQWRPQDWPTVTTSTGMSNGPIEVFTDGSLIGNRHENTIRGGAGVFFGLGHDCNVATFVLADKVDVMLTELTAMYFALHVTPPFRDVVIMTDSQSAIKEIARAIESLSMGKPAICSKYHYKTVVSNIVDEIRLKWKHQRSVTLAYVQAHADVIGNEGADCLAKMGARLLPPGLELRRSDEVAFTPLNKYKFDNNSHYKDQDKKIDYNNAARNNAKHARKRKRNKNLSSNIIDMTKANVKKRTKNKTARKNQTN
ncbi:hypothetical protein V1514DRAFT_337876 [Lipomyces japonicus]|uniref:uncharacterized protein n=1 Tax=Lipomyces japonicus TaxID=56871 RepID=UPI0034CDAFBF